MIRDQWKCLLFEFSPPATNRVYTISVKLFVKLVLFAVILISGIGIGISYKSRELTTDECFRMGSNERMAACLAEVKRRQDAINPPPAINPNTIEILGNDVKPNNIHNVTLKNNSNYAVKNITMRFQFYKKVVKDCSSPPDDTQYSSISDIILSGDTKIVTTFVNTPIQHQYSCVNVLTAAAY